MISMILIKTIRLVWAPDFHTSQILELTLCGSSSSADENILMMEQNRNSLVTPTTTLNFQSETDTWVCHDQWLTKMLKNSWIQSF